MVEPAYAVKETSNRGNNIKEAQLQILHRQRSDYTYMESYYE